MSTPTATVERFEHVGGAELRHAPLPGDPAREARARTLQPVRAPLLDGDVARAQAPTLALAVRLTGASLMTETGAVATADGRLILQSLIAPELWDRCFARPTRIRRPQTVEGEHASLISLWSENYYHWLVDCLPRVATLQAAGLGDLPLVVPQRLEGFQRDSLEAIGVTGERLTAFPEIGGNLAPDRLVWASPPAPVNFPTPFVVDWLRRNLRDHGPAPRGDTRRRHRRLLVSRTGVARTLVNEEDLLRALEPMGFELITPDRLDLAGQAAAFAEASAIVGPHGAGLANIVFSDPLPVLELFPADYVTWHYYTLSRAAGHDYWYAVGVPAPPGRRRPADGHFVVDVELVLRSVEAMLESAETAPDAR